LFNEKEKAIKLLQNGVLDKSKNNFHKNFVVLSKFFKYLGYNKEKSKEMIINWLEFRIRDMKQKERAKFDEKFQLNPREEILKMIKNLVDGSPTTSILNSPPLPPDLGVVPAKLSPPHQSLDNL
jgi:hypothetical protein